MVGTTPPAVRSVLRRTFWLIVLTLTACAGPGEPSPNLSILKADCVQWRDSGDYDRAFTRAAEPAMRTLEGYLRHETPQNFAIVFDIDETLLSNWPYLSSTQFAINGTTFAAWTKRERGIPLAPMQAIYAKAHAYQIPIFLVTGRGESLRAATIHDLEEAGYWGWSGLYLRPATDTDASMIPFKSGIRKMLTERGYDIILNVGDQDSDLAGGYARHAFKLPNPFYFIP